MGTFSEIARPAAGGIIEDFSTIFRPNHVIEVAMPVRGLTIWQEIIVVDCHKDQLIAHTSNISHFCANQSGQPVLLRNQAQDHYLVARVLNLALPHGRVTLAGMQEIQRSWFERVFERVQPAEPVFLKLGLGRHIFRACLKDISHTGMSVTVSLPRASRAQNFEGKRLSISLSIPPALPAIILRCEVMHSDPLTGCLARLGLRFTLSKKNAALLDAYIQSRKHEILEEVRETLFGMWKNQETKDEYF